MWKRKILDVYRAPFPLYSVKVDPKTGLVITAGGGGASKTGIKNAVHFLDVQLVGEHQYSASLLHSHDTSTRATMNVAVGDGVIAAGQDGTCCVMKTRFSKQKKGSKAAAEGAKSSQQAEVRRRAGKGERSGATEAAAADDEVSEMKEESAHISVTTLAELQSDLNPQDPLQKVVRFSPDMSLLLTGGTDGHLRVWEFPSLKKRFDFKAHDGEIEDLDMSPGNKHLVTVSRGFSCSVWVGNQLALALKWTETKPEIPDTMYRYLACRFGKVEDQKDALRLYTVQIPHKRDRKHPPCYITKWDGKSFLPMLTSPCGAEVISTLAVSLDLLPTGVGWKTDWYYWYYIHTLDNWTVVSISDSGTFLGLGTVTGSVAIYITFSLQRLYYVKESHGIVVTDLAFLPDSLDGRNLRGDNETAMLSVAVDSRCQVHAVPNPRWFPVWLLLVLCGLMVVGVILLLQQLFPGFI